MKYRPVDYCNIYCVREMLFHDACLSYADGLVSLYRLSDGTCSRIWRVLNKQEESQHVRPIS